MKQTFKLPIPPSVNAMFANLPGRGRIKTSAYKSWITEAGWEVLRAKPKLIKGRVMMAIYAGKTDNRRRDLDNLIKSVSDLMVSHGVIEDDSKVWDIRARWEPGLEGLTVTVEALSEEVEAAA